MSEKKDPNFKEKRKFPRVPDDFFVMYRIEAPFMVHIQLGAKNLDAFAQDIGEGGLGLTMDQIIFNHAQILMRFTLYDEDAVREKDRLYTFALEGEVIYQKRKDKDSYRIGARFLSISAQERAFIAQYIKSRSLKPIR